MDFSVQFEMVKKKKKIREDEQKCFPFDKCFMSIGKWLTNLNTVHVQFLMMTKKREKNTIDK